MKWVSNIWKNKKETIEQNDISLLAIDEDWWNFNFHLNHILYPIWSCTFVEFSQYNSSSTWYFFLPLLFLYFLSFAYSTLLNLDEKNIILINIYTLLIWLFMWALKSLCESPSTVTDARQVFRRVYSAHIALFSLL